MSFPHVVSGNLVLSVKSSFTDSRPHQIPDYNLGNDTVKSFIDDIILN